MENKRKNSINQQKSTNLWQEILREAMPKTEIDNTNLFVFGDNLTGKRLLFKGMNRAIFENSQDADDKRKENQRTEEIAKFSLIDYTFLNILDMPNDKNSEIIGKLNVWIMNFFIDKEKIMELIRPVDLLNSICLIIVDLSRPWTIKESLTKWTKLIQEAFGELVQKLPEKVQNKIKENGKKIILIYTNKYSYKKNKVISRACIRWRRKTNYKAINPRRRKRKIEITFKRRGIKSKHWGSDSFCNK